MSDHEELVKRVEEAEKEIAEGKRREKSLAEELGRKDEEISRMRENAVEREKVMREVEIAVQKEKMAQVHPPIRPWISDQSNLCCKPLKSRLTARAMQTQQNSHSGHEFYTFVQQWALPSNIPESLNPLSTPRLCRA